MVKTHSERVLLNESCMNKINEKYLELCNTPSDINEHLPTLKRYAEQCDHVTEFGVRNVVSSWALLAGQPKRMVSVDINECPITELAYEAQNSNIDFSFIQADTGSKNLNIEETDLLFIDTWHICGHLKKELALHADKARKYIIFHDTTTFGYFPESAAPHLGEDYIKGLIPAIDDFLKNHPEWEILEKFENNNGLTVLHRV